MGHAGQGGAQLGHHAGAIVVFGAIGHAIAGDQHLGRDLFEAIEHGIGAHVGRAHTPDGAQTDHRKKSHHGFWNIGQVNGHAVTGLDTLCAEVACHGGDLATQLRPGHFAPLASLVVADDGQLPGGLRRFHMPQDLLRIVHLRAGKPLGPRHGVAGQHRCVGRG